MPPTPGYTAPKLLWLAEHEPDQFARIVKVLLPKDYVRLKLTGEHATDPVDDEQMALLARYADAFERYDMDSLVALLHEDATLSMPPYALWMVGHDNIRDWMLGPGKDCRGSRLVPTMANGTPAFGQYRPSGPGGRHEAWALQVIEVSGDRIAGIHSFLDTERIFPAFGLPSQPPAQAGQPRRRPASDELPVASSSYQ